MAELAPAGSSPTIDSAIAPPGPDQSATDQTSAPNVSVGGVITTNTTWSLAGSPYTVVSDVTVADGVTLTVEAGVQVIFNPITYLYVNGNLAAVGTAAAPITFTAPVTTTGYWGFIQIGGGSVLTDSDRSQLSHVTIEYGGWVGQSSLRFEHATPTLDHLTIQHNGGTGLETHASGFLSIDTATLSNNGRNGLIVDQSLGLTLTNVTASHNGIHGIEVSFNGGGVWLQNVAAQSNLGDGVRIVPQNSSVTIVSATLANNGGYGLFDDVYDISPALTLNLQDSAITNNGVAARLAAATTLTNVDWTGNTRNEIEWAGGTLDSDKDWGMLPAGINTYHLIRRVIVPDGITLTIGAGVTVLMHQAEYLNVFGNLHASGTAFSPIHFAPYVSGVNGYWAHIGIGGGSILTDSNQSQLRYVTLDSGGAFGSSLYVNTATPVLDHLTIRNSSGNAAEISYSDNLAVTNSSFSGNVGYGLYNTTPNQIVTATLDYWDAAGGPYHPTLNPGGTGERVSDGVVFNPWNPAFSLPGDGRLSGATLSSNSNVPQAEHFAYDVTGRLTSLSSHGYSTFTLSYLYDASSRLLARTPVQGDPLSLTYGYDAADRLTQTAISSPLGLVWQEAYDYDAAGNLTGVNSSRDGAITYTYDPLNRLTGISSSGFNANYGYDAAGNRTSAGGVTYSYDAGGRLIGASDGTTYAYDAAGRCQLHPVGADHVIHLGRARSAGAHRLRQRHV